jgi:hypothetical protein
MSTLQEFTASIKNNGLARQNRFLVEFSLPGIMKFNSYGADLRNILLFCESASFPGVNILTTQNRTYGEFREIPYEIAYEPVNLVFYVDSKMAVKSFFDDWLLNIYDPVTRDANYYNDYICELNIWQIDLADRKTYNVTCFEAYPKSIAPLELSQNSRDIHRLSVQFAYKYYRPARVSTVRENNIPFKSKDDIISSVGEQVSGLPETVKVPGRFLDNFGGFQESINTVIRSTTGNSVGNPGGIIRDYAITKGQVSAQNIVRGLFR